MADKIWFDFGAKVDFAIKIQSYYSDREMIVDNNWTSFVVGDTRY